jgi:hypothetical protein
MKRFHTAIRAGVLLGFTAIGLALCTPANAQEMCGPTEKVHAALTEKFAEQRIWGGLTGGPNLSFIEVWVNPETDTWTILQTYPDGKSCVREDGTGYDIEELDPAGDPS